MVRDTGYATRTSRRAIPWSLARKGGSVASVWCGASRREVASGRAPTYARKVVATGACRSAGPRVLSVHAARLHRFLMREGADKRLVATARLAIQATHSRAEPADADTWPCPNPSHLERPRYRCRLMCRRHLSLSAFYLSGHFTWWLRAKRRAGVFIGLRCRVHETSRIPRRRCGWRR